MRQKRIQVFPSTNSNANAWQAGLVTNAKPIPTSVPATHAEMEVAAVIHTRMEYAIILARVGRGAQMVCVQHLRVMILQFRWTSSRTAQIVQMAQ
jgi:hypothetical protein